MAAVQIALKDLKQRVRDRSAFLWGIVAPLGLAAIFSMLFGPIADFDVSFAVADLDGGTVASAFVDQLEDLEADGTITLEVADDAASAEDLVEDGSVDAAFVIPVGFTDAVSAGATVEVGVIGNVDQAIGTQVARSVAAGFAGEINTVGAAACTVLTARDESCLGSPSLGSLAATALAEPAFTESPVTLAGSPAASKELSSETFYSAAMAILFLFLTVQFGVLGLLEERQNGTMLRLLAAPISARSIVAGKALTSFVLGLVSMTVLVVGTTLLLGAEWGNSLGVAVMVLAGVIAAMGIMFVVAAFARTPEQASNLQSIIAFVLAMLGGSFFPIAQVGGLVAQLSLLTPHAWFLRGLGDLAAGGGVGAVFPAALYVALFGIVTGGLAQLRIGRVLQA
ncbi:MAG: ABC transporter permease [Acidimicrobiia bacterium]|nr:ABC transporter permease [Acidimicrobiia bacterium]MBT8248256.1 ABC transporter permease [Acidimicrobiia bacterium]NNF87862.1 ABC transporter permease [Acidimicrobiia bacterium]NNL12804.1 ABC transporter permease [Acidimicrobiia bacterium]NNL68678.1 ABC transporter permease [Acidimicrobiia bacterium]